MENTPKIKIAIRTVFVGFACRMINGIQEKSSVLEISSKFGFGITQFL